MEEEYAAILVGKIGLGNISKTKKSTLENRMLIGKYVVGHSREVRKIATVQFDIDGLLGKDAEGMHNSKNLVTLG